MSDTRETAIARLHEDIETGRVDEIGQFLLEYLADWGPDHIDVQALAQRVLDRVGEPDDALLDQLAEDTAADALAEQDEEGGDPCDLCGSRTPHEECDPNDLDDYNADPHG